MVLLLLWCHLKQVRLPYQCGAPPLPPQCSLVQNQSKTEVLPGLTYNGAPEIMKKITFLFNSLIEWSISRIERNSLMSVVPSRKNLHNQESLYKLPLQTFNLYHGP